MLNMIDTQDKLKNFSEQQLIQEMQRPSGSAPQFMVLGEIERRKRMRADAQRQEGLMQPTVAQEAVSAAGVPQQGIAQVAQSLAPQTDMTQNTGVPNVQAAGLPGQPNQPQRMADGGILRLQAGGTINAIANLKVNYPDIYATVKDDPEQLRLTAEYFLNVAEDPAQTGLESLAAPREYDLMKRMFSDPTRGDIIDQQKRDAAEFGDDYALDQRAQSLINQRQAELAGNEMLFDDPAGPEGKVREFVSGTTGPTPVVSVPAMAAAPAMPSGDLSYAINPALDGVVMPAPDMGVKTPSGFGEDPMPAPSMDAAPDVSGLTEEQARRLYLSGRDYEESDVPAIVDMLNRGREFQQSDMYTPPEKIYDLGPRGQLKYEMDENASPIEQYRAFTDTSNRLAREAAADERTKEDAFFAAEDARFDAQRRMDQALDRKMDADARARDLTIDEKVGGLAERLIDAALTPSGPGMTKGDPLTIPAGGIAEIMPPKSEAEKAAEAAALADKVAGTDKPTGGEKTGTGKKSGIAAEKSKMDQDKWLALAQAGLTLMSTGDFGKAGSAGLAALRESGKADREERKLEAELTLREAQLAAANRKGSGSALTANQLLSRGNDLIKSGQTMLESAGDNADAAAEAQKLIMAGQELIRRVTGGVASSGPTGAIKLPSAG